MDHIVLTLHLVFPLYKCPILVPSFAHKFLLILNHLTTFSSPKNLNIPKNSHLSSMDNLPKCGANYVSLTPLTFLTRASKCYANRTSIIYGNVRFTWRQTYERCCRFASSLRSLNVVENDVVSKTDISIIL